MSYLIAAVALSLVIGIGFYLSCNEGSDSLMVSTAEAAGGKVLSPTGTAPDRYLYFPGTEALGKDEIRLIALGTGMPAARRSQAATCWLVEVGNVNLGVMRWMPTQRHRNVP